MQGAIYSFLEKLDHAKIFYKLSRIREESILVEVAVPGQRWEIEFFSNNHVEIEKFRSDGTIYDESKLETLLETFRD